ncbi:MAG: geranylgeranyl reductase family protein [Cyanobacteria bacterium P01_H01_bin.121]
MYDCIVVGAGPAGAATAYHLAKQGRSVVVLEKESLPRYKACGGGISPQIAKWFDFSFEPVIVGRIDQFQFTWKLEDPVKAVIDTSEPMWLIERQSFDHYLVEQAQQCGAVFKDATPATGITFHGDQWDVSTPAGTLTARYLVAADGATGPTAAWLGEKGRKTRTAYVVEIPKIPTKEASHQGHVEFGLLKNGYIWAFPKQSGWTISAAVFRGGEPKNLPAILKQYIQYLGGDPQQAQFHTTQLYAWDGDRPLHKQQALLVGETAGLVDPFSGEGVRPALLSGTRAAEAINAALAGDRQALAEYTNRLKTEWLEDMSWSAKIAAVFYRIPGVAYQIGVKRPSARARMGKILSGELRYSEIAIRAIKRLTTNLIPGMGGK